MYDRVVITHPEMGIYVGSAIGFGFWSKLDSVGQDSVVTFENEDDARDYVRSWAENNDDSAYGYHQVSTVLKEYAEIPELIAAGLRDELGDMLHSALEHPSMGMA